MPERSFERLEELNQWYNRAVFPLLAKMNRVFDEVDYEGHSGCVYLKLKGREFIATPFYDCMDGCPIDVLAEDKTTAYDYMTEYPDALIWESDPQMSAKAYLDYMYGWCSAWIGGKDALRG